jgi:hypothetical protein
VEEGEPRRWLVVSAEQGGDSAEKNLTGRIFGLNDVTPGVFCKSGKQRGYG